MEKINSVEEFSNALENTIKVNDSSTIEMDNTSIIFNGKNNILVIEDGARIKNSTIQFNGDNAICYLRSNKHIYYLKLTLNINTTIYFGKDCYINGAITAITSEQKNIIIGNEGLFSYGIVMRTADPHLIYDCESKKRLNPSKSVFVGDHVWLGQGAILLKGSHIGSGSIIGGNAVVAGKKICSNASAVGNPAKVIKQGVFFSKKCVHAWTDDITSEYETMDTDKWTYQKDKHTISFEDIDKGLAKCSTAEERLAFITDNLVNYKHKNRFYIAPAPIQKKGLFGRK